MSNYNSKSVPSLFHISTTFIIKYTHHVVWRRLDPPPQKHNAGFDPVSLPILSPLPNINTCEQKNPAVFRARFCQVRDYFSENLVRPVHENLSTQCSKFITENRLQVGDLVLQLVFQDQYSKALVIKAKHIIYRRWTLREERTLQRSLAISKNLVKIALPGKADDKIMKLIGAHCSILEDLDVSTSYLTDVGLLAICGVSVDTSETLVQDEESKSIERGRICKETGKFVRASAARAKRNIDSIKNNEQTFLRDIAQGSTAFELLKLKFPDLGKTMKPFMRKREEPEYCLTWTHKRGVKHSFTSVGCKNLKKLDLWKTNFPKRTVDGKGELITDLGITREVVLASLILMKQLKILKWTDLGEILQLFEFVYQENKLETPKLDLTFLCDSRLTLDKLDVTKNLCPNISKLDISMFNFSFVEQEFVADSNALFYNSSLDDKFGKSSSLFFQFNHLTDLEVQYMDDSKTFHNCIQAYASSLTRICLNKMISISFETLAAIKTHCPKLQVLDIYVDHVYTFKAQTTIEQVVAETPNTSWESLKSLKLGGTIPTGSILEFLIRGCSNLRVLCYSLYDDPGEMVTDGFIENLLNINPMKELVAFYFEKSVLTEATFFLVANNLPKIKYVGILSEWGGIDRRGILAIRAFIRGNNLNVDIESIMDQYNL